MVHFIALSQETHSEHNSLNFKTKRRLSVATSPAVPFKQRCIRELRYVSVYLHDDVAGILTYFDDIQRHGQLEKLKISGYVD